MTLQFDRDARIELKEQSKFNGTEKFHVRTIGSYKRRHPELNDMTNKEIMTKYGWRYIEASGKHRYVYLRGEKWITALMYERIKIKISPYPK